MSQNESEILKTLDEIATLCDTDIAESMLKSAQALPHQYQRDNFVAALIAAASKTAYIISGREPTIIILDDLIAGMVRTDSCIN